MKKNTDKIGYTTSKIQDSENNKFAKDKKFISLKKITCFSNADGIHGFFPYFNTAEDEIVNSASFHRDFIQIYLPLLEKKEGDKKLVKEEIYFLPNEFILSFVLIYQEEDKKITAIKVKTNQGSYSFGNKPELNKKIVLQIHKDGCFIPGWKTNYILEDGLPFLSFLQVYFEEAQYVRKYINHKPPSKYYIYLRKKTRQCGSVLTLLKIIITLLLLVSPFLYYYHISQNIYGGEYIIKDNSLGSPVQIFTDTNGIAHIKAQSKDDGFYALGFVHGKERLWQMDFLRRFNNGRLSELLGKKALVADKMIRSLGFRAYVEKKVDSFKKSKFINLVERYVDGINFFAENNYLPIEYIITKNKFEKWTVDDTLAVSCFLSWVHTQDWRMEVWYKVMEDNLGKEFAEMVFSFREKGFKFDKESIVNDEELEQMKLNLGGNTQGYKNQNNKKADEVHTENKKHTGPNKSRGNEDDLPIPNLNEGASNSWVISGKYTQSGKPIVSNDPHVENTMPTCFFISKMYLPDMTLSGAAFPGLPFYISGSNNHLAWGVTTENTETTDLCEEKIEGDHYMYDGKKHKLETVVEEIQIKDEEPVYMDVKYTRNGPIIDTILNDALRLNVDYTHYTPLSIRIYWMKFDYTPEFTMKVMFAKSKDEFVDDIEKLPSPSLNFVFASKNGDIGYYPIGYIPIKKTIRNSFCQGYNPEDDIIRHVRREETPRLINPSKGFIVTANNKIATSNYKFDFPGFHNNVRAYRIREMIEEKINKNEKFSIQNNIDMMQDTKDCLAEEILPKLLKIVEKAGKSSLPYFNELKNWNFVMSKESTTATVYSVLEYQLAKLLVSNKNMDDNLSNGILSILHFWNFIDGIIDKISRGELVELKRCALFTGTTNCEKLVVYLFENLDNYLDDFRDSSKNVLIWGQLKQNHYRHYPFDGIPYLKNIFSRTIPTSGNRNTVKIARGVFSNKNGILNLFYSNHSASGKFVCDLADINRPYVISDTGNSGKVNSKFYDNFLNKSEEAELVQLEQHVFDIEPMVDSDTIILRNRNISS